MKITLYIAGKARQSQSALKTVEAVTKEAKLLSAVCEIVDVLRDSERGVKAGLLTTPTLVLEHEGKMLKYMTPLPEASVLCAAIAALQGEDGQGLMPAKTPDDSKVR